jgi:hypothetical protein
MTVLNSIPIDLQPTAVCKTLRLPPDGDPAVVRQLIDTACELIEARALYTTCYIEEKQAAAVKISGKLLHSSILRKNLDPVERVFPFVLTLGGRLDDQIRKTQDLLDQYYLDAVGVMALEAAGRHLKKHLQDRFALGKMSFMAPGSLPDWPIEEQRPLFDLLGDAKAAIGVRLTDSFLMLPAKSISGIYFPAEASFYSCQLCPRKRCEGRKAPFDEKLAQQYGIKLGQ